MIESLFNRALSFAVHNLIDIDVAKRQNPEVAKVKASIAEQVRVNLKSLNENDCIVNQRRERRKAQYIKQAQT